MTKSFGKEISFCKILLIIGISLRNFPETISTINISYLANFNESAYIFHCSAPEEIQWGVNHVGLYGFDTSQMGQTISSQTDDFNYIINSHAAMPSQNNSILSLYSFIIIFVRPNQRLLLNVSCSNTNCVAYRSNLMDPMFGSIVNSFNDTTTILKHLIAASLLPQSFVTNIFMCQTKNISQVLEVSNLKATIFHTTDQVGRSVNNITETVFFQAILTSHQKNQITTFAFISGNSNLYFTCSDISSSISPPTPSHSTLQISSEQIIPTTSDYSKMLYTAMGISAGLSSISLIICLIKAYYYIKKNPVKLPKKKVKLIMKNTPESNIHSQLEESKNLKLIYRTEKKFDKSKQKAQLSMIIKTKYSEPVNTITPDLDYKISSSDDGAADVAEMKQQNTKRESTNTPKN